jgi:hypothetical protein
VKNLLILLLVLASCSVSNKKMRNEPPHFFACNRWADHNKNGMFDSFEFENIKGSFHASEEVLFVGFFAGLPAGSVLKFSLFAPDGSLVHEYTQVHLFDRTLLQYDYSVGELISQGFTGVWVGEWDVDDEVVAETEVNFNY